MEESGQLLRFQLRFLALLALGAVGEVRPRILDTVWPRLDAGATAVSLLKTGSRYSGQRSAEWPAERLQLWSFSLISRSDPPPAVAVG